MSFAHIIADLRASADRICTQAAEDRETAVRHETAAETCRRTASLRDELARTYSLLADALGTGRITRDQLREIVNVEMLNDEPDAHWADRQWWNDEARTKDEDKDAERENRDRAEDRGFEVDDVVNVSDVESPDFGRRGTVVSTWTNDSITVNFGVSGTWSFRASQLMHHAAFVAQMDDAERQAAKDPEPADEQPRDVFGRCAVHLLPLDENGVCQFNEDDQHPEKDDGHHRALAGVDEHDVAYEGVPMTAPGKALLECSKHAAAFYGGGECPACALAAHVARVGTTEADR